MYFPKFHSILHCSVNMENGICYMETIQTSWGSTLNWYVTIKTESLQPVYYASETLQVLPDDAILLFYNYKFVNCIALLNN